MSKYDYFYALYKYMYYYYIHFLSLSQYNISIIEISNTTKCGKNVY